MKQLLLAFTAFLLFNFSITAQPISFDWGAAMGGKGTNEGSIGIAKDASGNVYIAGEFSGTRTFGSFTLTAVGFYDLFVAKYSTNGTCLWAIRGGSGFSSAYAGKIAVDGNVLFVTGSFSNILDINGLAIASTGSKDIFVAGFDVSNGMCTWIEKAGSTFDDIPYGITLATGGGFYICGTFTGNATFGTQMVSSSSIIDFDIFFAKYTATGSCTWVKRVGSTDADKAFAIKELPNGNIIITGSYEGTVMFGPGTTFTSTGYADFFLAQYNSVGDFVWAFSGGGANNDVGYGLGIDTFGSIYATGFIADTAVFGAIPVNNSGNINVIVAKFGPLGTCQWVSMGGNVNDDIGFDISTDFGGSSYVTGYVNGNCFFGNTQLSGVNGNDAFVVKYDLNGSVRWITKIGGTDLDRGKAILADVGGYCYVAGDFEGNTNLGPTAISAPLGVTGIFFTRMGGGTIGVNDIDEAPFSFYPNPAKDFVMLNLDKISDAAFTVSILTIDGKVVQSNTLNQNDAIVGYRLQLPQVATGKYIVKLESSLGDYSKSLLIGK